MKHPYATPGFLALVLLAGFSAPALAAGQQISNVQVSTGIILVLAIGIVFAYRAISARLKKVSKDIEESFGEKLI